MIMYIFMKRQAISNLILVILAVLISALFLTMIRGFLITLLMAAIFSAVAQPIYRRLARLIGFRYRTAALITLLLFCGVILLPLVGLGGIITVQAVKVGQMVTPWIQGMIDQPSPFSQLLRGIFYHKELLPFHKEILEKTGEMAGRISIFLLNSLSAGAVGTLNIIIMSIIFLYSSYFLLIEGKELMDRILYYLPLEEERERRLLDRFSSVTRATLKGTAIIGVLQGGLAGAAFAVVGIEAAVFWGAIMAILSIIPAFGTALVWFPAAIILAGGGSYMKALGLALFCGIVVGTLDNVLRPWLVGKDTELHDLLVLFSTLGGLSLFGLIGYIIGPIIAALFVTVWEIYGEAFRSVLPPGSGGGPSEGGSSKKKKKSAD
jgi:predicted PurR-regulated permease PerM